MINRTKERLGATYVELLIVIGLIAIIGASVSPFLSNFILRNNLETTVDNIVSTLRKSQSYAIAGKNNESGEDWGVCFYNNATIRLFLGSCNSPTIEEDFSVPGSVEITGLNTITFSRLEGEPSQTLTITVSTNIGTETIILNAAGGIGASQSGPPIDLPTPTPTSTPTPGPTATPTPTPTPAGDPWWNVAWSHRKKITIASSKVAANLSNFPVLINITDTDLSSKAQTDGDDIVFADKNAIKLDHEIERYTSGTGNLIAWIEVVSLSSTVDTILYMYYGNAAAANQQNPTSVWDANYVGVLHLKESPNGTLDELNDSSGNANHGQTFGMAAANSVDAKIGKGLNFVKSDQQDQIRIYESASLDGLNDEGTMSFWINYVAAPHASDPQLTMAHSLRFSLLPTYGRGMEHAFNPNGNFFFYPNAESGAGGGGSNWYGKTNPPISSGVWASITWRWRLAAPKEVALFVDGAQQVLDNNPLALWIAAANMDDWYWGGHADRNTRWLDGKMDEIRLSSLARSTGWIQTEYNNQNSPSTFYSIGNEEVALAPVGGFLAGAQQQILSALKLTTQQVLGIMTEVFNSFTYTS